jgi:glycyl-tRNA synthetase beta subunit
MMLQAAIGNRRGRATKAKQARRVMAVYSMLEHGTPRPIILDYARSAWRISTRQTDTYIAAASAIHTDRFERDAAFYFAQALERLNDVFNEAFEAGNYSAALKAQQQINRLCGLYAS